MTIEELEDENLTIYGYNKKPLTKDDRDFLILIKRLEEQNRFDILLALHTLFVALVKK